MRARDIDGPCDRARDQIWQQVAHARVFPGTSQVSVIKVSVSVNLSLYRFSVGS